MRPDGSPQAADTASRPRARTTYAIRVRRLQSVHPGAASWWGWCLPPEEATLLQDLSQIGTSPVWQHPALAPRALWEALQAETTLGILAAYADKDGWTRLVQEAGPGLVFLHDSVASSGPMAVFLVEV